MPKFLVEVELSERECKYLCSNSVERVLNAVGDFLDASGPPESVGWASDLADCKPIATRLWTATHNAVFKSLNPDGLPWCIRMGNVFVYQFTTTTGGCILCKDVKVAMGFATHDLARDWAEAYGLRGYNVYGR